VPEVKCLSASQAQFYELARKEIGALILSDEHPNIVRCFAMEEDNEFVYLALERCRHSLNDLIVSEGGSVYFVDEARRPTPFCMQVRAPAFPPSAKPVSFHANPWAGKRLKDPLQ
jgi:hypothetical protein